ncbi:M23 family metallopeptidase [Leptothrix discophora]|uniref:M23 family metallopeptidase n=1 Tax=Leptothrix discophora TaxID=89 RepID=A0ABT9G5X8_LEPDI|nr:M23 family metallopeptidase [Leptothrix discophora]MDP4301891.1 M23 family metallopeptidase [Leptothrix discophora]
MARAELALRQHPRVLSGAALTVLLGSAVTAFGVAPLTPIDTTPVSTRIITETLGVPDLGAQEQALDALSLALHRNDLTRAGDTADTLLSRLGIQDAEAAAFLRRDRAAQRILIGRTGKRVQATSVAGPSGQLQQLVVRGPALDSAKALTHFSRVTLQRVANGFSIQEEDVALGVQLRSGAGTIRSSLFAAADQAGLPDSVTVQMAEIFGSDIDFRRELRKGDTFAVVYEALSADGEPLTWGVNVGRVLSARFVNDGHTLDAVWYQDGEQRGGYYGADGKSKARVFLASPLAFSRVSSGFSMRFHPILQQWRAHLGVDYAAPTGTAVRSVGDGTVEFAGVQNGYGNVVMVRHGGEHSTVYAHLSRIGVRVGQKVVQGDTLGAVGSTGWATGPHLHFEFKQGGRQVDPIKVARSSEAVSLSAAALSRFRSVSQTAQGQLDGAIASAGAVAQME